MDDASCAVFAIDCYIRPQVLSNQFAAPDGWAIIPTVAASPTAGFSATAYLQGNTIVIGYRGTDDPNDYPSDFGILVGWEENVEQLPIAIEFYKQIYLAFPNAEIIVAGHSLGGALAGAVAGLFGLEGHVYDPLEFASLYNYVRDAALAYDDDPESATPQQQYLRELTYGADPITPISAGNISGAYVVGELASLPIFGGNIAGLDDISLPADSEVTDPNLLHDPGLLSILLHMATDTSPDWNVGGKYIVESFYNDETAVKAGFNDPNIAFLGGGSASNYLKRALAYAAEGSDRFGSTAVASAFHDGVALGEALNHGTLDEAIADLLGETAVVYAGSLALAGADVGQGGVLVFDEDYLSVRFDDGTWSEQPSQIKTDALEHLTDALFEYAGIDEEVSSSRIEHASSFNFLVSEEAFQGALDEQSDETEIWVGTGRGDTVQGTTHNDTIFGGFGGYEGAHSGGTFDGGEGNDLIVGTFRDDVFNTTEGIDTLSGGGGGDIFHLGGENSISTYALGGLGSDVFDTEGGHLLSGGAGNNSFNVEFDTETSGMTVIWGGEGADNYNIVGNSANIVFIEVAELDESAFLSLGYEAALDVIGRLMSGYQGWDYFPAESPDIIIINADSGDHLSLNGKIAHGGVYLELYTSDEPYTTHYEAGYGVEDGSFFYETWGGTNGTPAGLSLYEEYTFGPGFVEGTGGLLTEGDPWNIVGYQPGLAGISLIGNGPSIIEGSDMIDWGEFHSPDWDPTPIDVNAQDISFENEISGTLFSDTLAGTTFRDRLSAGAGNDDVSPDLSPSSAARGPLSVGVSASDLFDGGAGIDTLNFTDAVEGIYVDLKLGQASGAEIGLDRITGFENAIGGAGIDSIYGTFSDNELAGNGGDDYLDGRDGADVLSGGDGDDTLVGGAGADALDGGDGFDVVSYLTAGTGIYIHAGNLGSNMGDAAGDSYSSIEVIAGSDFDDEIHVIADSAGVYSGAGNDQVFGSGNAVSFYGEDGDDDLWGDYGNDRLEGGAGNDFLFAYTGDDILIGGAGADELYGGDGLDVASYETATTGIYLHMGQDPASNTGDAAGDLLSDIEIIRGSTFGDEVYVIADFATVYGNAGDDQIFGSSNAVSFFGEEGNDDLWGDYGNDWLDGGAGSDYLFSYIGDDILIGGAGADELYGGDGFDIASYETAATSIVFDTTDLGLNTGDAAGDTYDGIEGIRGSNFADLFVISSDDAKVYGGAGNDVINLIGWAGFAYGEAGDDTLAGDAYLDNLDGGDGNDTLNGGAGADTMIGGLGNDTFVFNAGSDDDIILDFAIHSGQPNGDIIELHDQSVSTFAALMANATESGGTALIHLDGGDTIALHGVSLASLDTTDFRFV